MPNGAFIFRGNSEMAQRMRAFDWSATSLGHPDTWPRSLQTIVQVLLTTRSPMFLWWGENLLQFYNDAYRPSLGNAGKHPAALGATAASTWPEIWPVIKPLIDQVLQTGIGTWAEDQLIPIYRNGHLEDVYWTFGYSPVENDEGVITGVLVICNETTAAVDNLKQLTAANEALLASEQYFRNLILQAPVAIGYLEGQNLIVNAANERLLNVWGKDESVIGQPLEKALPELHEQPFLDILHNVLSSGKPYFGNASRAVLEHNAELREFYFDFVYQPVKDVGERTTGIMVVANDVTWSVQSRNKIQTAQETLRLSLDAARLGTFDMDLVNNTMNWDDRCRELFGIDHHDPVSYEHDFLPNLHEEDRERIERQIRDVFVKEITGGEYDVEYRTVGVNDKKLRWVRAKGKAFFDESAKPIRFIGAVLEITDRKMAEMQRNDFFAMASHELKTPLTAIKGYTQILQKKAIGDQDTFRIQILEKMDASVNKMTALIRGFLNNTRLIEGKLDLNVESVDLETLLNQVYENARFLITSHRLRLIPCAGICVNADYTAILQVMDNLVNNAIKYSPAGGQIIVGCEIERENVKMYVKDDGIGISKKDQEHLFDRFYRVQHKELKNVPGFGIGLYLVAEILRYHQSEIKVESKEGAGSMFYFLLPISNHL